MSDAENIANFFIDSGMKPVGSIVWDKETSNHLVFISVDINKAGKQSPSNYKLASTEKRAEATFGDITLILVNRGDEDIANSIKSLLLRRFNEDIRNVFSRIQDGFVTVWVETKYASSKEKTDEMTQPITGIVEYFGLKLANFVNISELNLPSETFCISTLRRKAPVSPSDLVEALRRRGFEVPGEDWLFRILDKWRRRGLIHRQSNGSLLMTVKGLKALGSGKNRRSPDVVRALDLARRTQ